MKTLIVVFSVAGLITLNSCKQDPGTNSCPMLENKESRSELMNDIMNNHEFMTEFMEHLQKSNHSMQMMQNNKKMMGAMMQGGGMQMMMKDSTTIHSMMNSMMGNGEMMETMMKMMHDQGMMSDDCMKSSMKMMSDKGMNMSNMHSN